MNSKKSTVQFKLLLLCAGSSRRFQSAKVVACANKNGRCKPVVQHAIDSITGAFKVLGVPYKNIYLTTGKYHQEIVHALNVNEDIRICYCDKAYKGMSYSLIQGIDKILKESPDTTHIMIALADQIALTTDDYVKMIKLTVDSQEQIICAKSPNGLTAPVIFPYQYFESLKQLKGDVGAKSVVLSNLKNVKRVLIESAEFDIDTQTDLNIWNEKQLSN